MIVQKKQNMEVNHLVQFSGKTIETTVTSKASVAEEWMQSILKLLKQDQGYRAIGMDCKFNHHPISSMSNKIATLQLCFETKCLVLQLLHMDSIPQSIRDFLGDSHTIFVGLDVKENSGKLLKEYALGVNRTCDIHFLAKRWFPMSYKEKPSMRALAYGIVGFSKRRCCKNRVLKGDWESRVLDTELVEQACVDAYASYSIAHKLFRYDSV